MIGARAPRLRPDAATLLARLLAAEAHEVGVTLAVEAWHTHPWASATFVGERHEAVLTLAGPGTAAWTAALPEADLPLRGHLVADILIEAADDGRFRLAALTLSDA